MARIKPSNIDFEIREGDTYPALVGTLREEDSDGVMQVVDVSAPTTVTFNARKKATRAVVVTGGACSYVTDGTDGKVQYTFTAAQTADTGKYEGEFKVDFGGGVVGRWPSSGYIDFEILDAIV